VPVSGEWAESCQPEPAGCSANPGGQSASNHHADQGSEGVWPRGGPGHLGAASPQPAASQSAPAADDGAQRLQPLLPGQVNTKEIILYDTHTHTEEDNVMTVQFSHSLL